MTFTYNLVTPDNITRMRFHLGDTVEPPKFEDEELTFILSENSNTIGPSVIAAIKGLIARLAGDPNFTADWLQVDIKTAIDALKTLLSLKAAEFEIGIVGASFVPMYRLDSDQTSTFDYSANARDEWAN